MGVGVSFCRTKRFWQSLEMKIERVQGSEEWVDDNDPSEEGVAGHPKVHLLTKAGWMKN